MLGHHLATLSLLAACTRGGPVVEPGPARGFRVLFIGNSLTASNDLPGTVAQLAASANDTIVVESVTRPNLAVIDHVNRMSNAVDAIRQGSWDYVVLQQGPTSQRVGRDTLVLAAQLLDPYIRAAGGRPAVLMTWPAAPNRSAFKGVLQSCLEAAGAVQGICFPAGEAWRAAWTVDRSLPLYADDEFHPSPLGTYLAALVVYEGITGHDARLLPREVVVAGRRLNASAGTVSVLQRVAHETIRRLAPSRPD